VQICTDTALLDATQSWILEPRLEVPGTYRILSSVGRNCLSVMESFVPEGAPLGVRFLFTLTWIGYP
jgi:hypothetical protein